MSIFVFLFWKIFETCSQRTISSSMSLFVFVFISMFILIYMFVFKRLCLCICLHGRLSSVSIQQAISYVYVYVPSRPCRRSALHISYWDLFWKRPCTDLYMWRQSICNWPMPDAVECCCFQYFHLESCCSTAGAGAKRLFQYFFKLFSIFPQYILNISSETINLKYLFLKKIFPRYCTNIFI